MVPCSGRSFNNTRFLVWACTVALLHSSARAATAFDRPQYICVNKAFPGGWLIDDPSTFTQSSIDAILTSFGGMRGGPARRLCVSFNAWTLIMTPANETTMLRSINALLALVEANDLPLSISLDPTQWWQSVPSIFNWFDPSQPGYDASNAANVEWTAPSPINATAISWRNWGSQVCRYQRCERATHGIVTFNCCAHARTSLSAVSDAIAAS